VSVHASSQSIGRGWGELAIEAIRKIINEAAEDPTLEEVTSGAGTFSSGMPDLVSASDTDSLGGY
jgi:hypothetical protein